MRFYEEFRPSGTTYEDRVGPPNTFEAAIGAVTVQFADLDDTISGAIAQLLRREPTVGVIVTAEMSFKNKVHLMAALARHELSSGAWKPIWSDTAEALPELAAICFKAEELRNGIIHASWEASDLGTHRRKRTAKAKGFRERILPGDDGSIFDVADYISYVVAKVDEFFAPGDRLDGDRLKASIRNVAT